MLHYSLQGTIASRVEEIIRKQTACDFELTADTDLLNDLAIDSLELVEMGLTLEKQFGKKLPIGELRRCITIGELVQLVESITREAVAASVIQEAVAASVTQETVVTSVTPETVAASVTQETVAASVTQETVAASVTQETVMAVASVEPVQPSYAVSESRSEISGSLHRRSTLPKAWNVVYGYMNNLVKGCIAYISQFFVGNNDLPQSGNHSQANRVQS